MVVIMVIIVITESQTMVSSDIEENVTNQPDGQSNTDDNNLNAVSYTHLDVYKRQACDWPTSVNEKAVRFKRNVHTHTTLKHKEFARKGSEVGRDILIKSCCV